MFQMFQPPPQARNPPQQPQNQTKTKNPTPSNPQTPYSSFLFNQIYSPSLYASELDRIKDLLVLVSSVSQQDSSISLGKVLENDAL